MESLGFVIRDITNLLESLIFFLKKETCYTEHHKLLNFDSLDKLHKLWEKQKMSGEGKVGVGNM